LQILDLGQDIMYYNYRHPGPDDDITQSGLEPSHVNQEIKLGMVAHAFNPNTEKAEAVESLSSRQV
ncbi:hypothetical protein STEG23_014846, partial [Scotinomys teguina]